MLHYVLAYQSIIEIENDKQWWDLYLLTDMKQNFQDWKAEKNKQQMTSKVMNKYEKKSLSSKLDGLQNKTNQK